MHDPETPTLDADAWTAARQLIHAAQMELLNGQDGLHDLERERKDVEMALRKLSNAYDRVKSLAREAQEGGR